MQHVGPPTWRGRLRCLARPTGPSIMARRQRARSTYDHRPLDCRWSRGVGTGVPARFRSPPPCVNYQGGVARTDRSRGPCADAACLPDPRRPRDRGDLSSLPRPGRRESPTSRRPEPPACRCSRISSRRGRGKRGKPDQPICCEKLRNLFKRIIFESALLVLTRACGIRIIQKTD
jgi:hypothetical protein